MSSLVSVYQLSQVWLLATLVSVTRNYTNIMRLGFPYYIFSHNFAICGRSGVGLVSLHAELKSANV